MAHTKLTICWASNQYVIKSIKSMPPFVCNGQLITHGWSMVNMQMETQPSDGTLVFYFIFYVKGRVHVGVIVSKAFCPMTEKLKPLSGEGDSLHW